MFKHKGHGLLAICGFCIVHYLADARLNIQQRCMICNICFRQVRHLMIFWDIQVINLCLWFAFNSSPSPWSEPNPSLCGHTDTSEANFRTEVQYGCKETSLPKENIIMVNVVCFLDSGNCSWNYFVTGTAVFMDLSFVPMSLLSRLFFEQEQLFRFSDVFAGCETSR